MLLGRAGRQTPSRVAVFRLQCLGAVLLCLPGGRQVLWGPVQITGGLEARLPLPKERQAGAPSSKIVLYRPHAAPEPAPAPGAGFSPGRSCHMGPLPSACHHPGCVFWHSLETVFLLVCVSAPRRATPPWSRGSQGYGALLSQGPGLGHIRVPVFGVRAPPSAHVPTTAGA